MSMVASPELRRHDDVLIPVGSETVAATRYQPIDADGPLPALLMYYPYRKDDHLTFGGYAPLIEYLAIHEYEVVTADLVGTGASSGRKRRPGKMPDEAEEAAEVVEWLGEQDWCDGSVGMFGKSYAGSTCLKAASREPTGLKAIIPMFTDAGGYRTRYGGVIDPWTRGGHWNPQMQVLQGLPTSVRDDAGRWASVWKEHLKELGEGEPWLFQSLEHEHKDEYWRDQEVDVSSITAATFGVSGWRDIAPGPTLEYIERIDAPKRAILGPFRHTMPHRGREVAIDFRRQAVEWFDHFLKDVDNGALNHETIEYWTERKGGGRVNEGVWRGTSSWPDVTGPDPVNDKMTYAFTPGGLVRERRYEQDDLAIDYDFDHTVGMHSLDEFARPIDTHEDDVRSLTFETDPLEKPVEYSGSGAVDVHLSSTTSDPLLVARVVDVSPAGRGNLVSHGRLRLSHRNSHSSPEELTPGTEYRVRVPLKPKSHVFERGHRIRVALSAAYFPVALPPHGRGQYTLFSTPSRPSVLTFPGLVHDGEVTFDNTVAMNQPDAARVPLEPTYVTNSQSTWSTSREHISDRASVSTTAEKEIDLPHGVESTFTQTIEAHVQADDPTSMYVYSETEMSIDYGTETASALVTCRTARDSTQYTTTVHVADQTVFEETFTR